MTGSFWLQTPNQQFLPCYSAIEIDSLDQGLRNETHTDIKLHMKLCEAG
jgi:hypothetical protein